MLVKVMGLKVQTSDMHLIEFFNQYKVVERTTSGHYNTVVGNVLDENTTAIRNTSGNGDINCKYYRYC